MEGFQQLVKDGYDSRVSNLVKLIESRMERVSLEEKLTYKRIEDLVLSGLDRLRVIEPKVKVIYKNITVESTKDTEFFRNPKKENFRCRTKRMVSHF